MKILALLLLACNLTACVAQLPLPDPPWLPPAASLGVGNSSGTTPNPQWSTLLGDLLYFYEAQRSGKLPSTNRVSWRNDSALQDGQDVGLDLTGGYYDAGDYIKATYPLSFTLMSICWGALDFGRGYDMVNQTAYLDSMLRWGLDWLIKAHPSPATLYVLVGDADTDNAYWGGDRGIPTPRLSYQINNTSPGTETAAQASAAFSACSLLYGSTSAGALAPASLQNSSYASTLLSHASDLHAFATNATGGLGLTQKVVPELADAYGASSYGDDLALSALFLAWASNSTDHYREAEGYYAKYGLSGLDGVLNWDGKAPALPVLFTQIATAAPGITSGSNRSTNSWQTEAESYFDAIVNGDSRGKLTKAGLLYYKGDSDEASLNPALNAAMLLTRYAPYASSSNRSSSYVSFANSQLDYALGNNPMSMPYIVGVNPNSPQNPHSAMSSGGNDIGNIDTDPLQEAYVLYGAAVGGPDRHDKFWDIRSDWVQGEVALDYNAPLLTLAAAHVMTDTSDPFYTALQPGSHEKQRPSGHPCDAAISCGGPHLSKGAQIAIGVVVSVVGLIIFGLLAWWIRLCIRNRS